MVCTTDLSNMQLITVLHTKGTFPVGRTSFREKVNFRPAMDKVADMLTSVCCSSTAVCLVQTPQLFFRLLSRSSPVFQTSDKHSHGESAWWLKLCLNLMLSLCYLLLEKPL